MDLRLNNGIPHKVQIIHSLSCKAAAVYVTQVIKYLVDKMSFCFYLEKQFRQNRVSDANKRYHRYL